MAKGAITVKDGHVEQRNFDGRAMRAGAAAYLLKSMPNDQILSVIRAVHTGRKRVPLGHA